MTNSPTPNQPNPNRRRRLTADELIAIVVALAGIGTVLFWGLGSNNRALNTLRGKTRTAGDNVAGTTRTNGAIDSETANRGTERRTIGSIFGRDRQSANVGAAANNSGETAPTTVIKKVEVPTEPTTAPTGNTAPVAATATAIGAATTGVATASNPTPTTSTPAFKDVPKQFWGETYITELKNRGILDDFGTGKFDPNQTITRGEFAKMLDRAFADKPTTATTAIKFTDIPANYQRKEAIGKTIGRGFMTGYSPTKFSPNQPMPRYQMQISLAKGLQLPIASNTETVLSKYSDASQMPKFAREKMASAIDAGLTVKDKSANLLKPTQNATRADAAALIYQILVKEGKIQPQQQQQQQQTP
jgi:hypothetical protein